MPDDTQHPHTISSRHSRSCPLQRSNDVFKTMQDRKTEQTHTALATPGKLAFRCFPRWLGTSVGIDSQSHVLAEVSRQIDRVNDASSHSMPSSAQRKFLAWRVSDPLNSLVRRRVPIRIVNSHYRCRPLVAQLLPEHLSFSSYHEPPQVTM